MLLFLKNNSSYSFLKFCIEGIHYCNVVLYVRGHTMLRCASENALFFYINCMYLYQIYPDLSFCKFNYVYVYKFLHPVNHPRPRILRISCFLQ